MPRASPSGSSRAPIPANPGRAWRAARPFPAAIPPTANTVALTYAILAPEYYQELLQAGVDFGLSRNIFGAHYPLDVIGGRLLATYNVAQMLNGTAGLCTIPSRSHDIDECRRRPAELSRQRRRFTNMRRPAPQSVAGCIAAGAIPTAAEFAERRDRYKFLLTYDLPSVGPTDLDPVVPDGAEVLLADPFPLSGARTSAARFSIPPSCLPACRSTTAAAGPVSISSRPPTATAPSATTSRSPWMPPRAASMPSTSGQRHLGPRRPHQGRHRRADPGRNKTYTGGTTVAGGTLGLSGSDGRAMWWSCSQEQLRRRRRGRRTITNAGNLAAAAAPARSPCCRTGCFRHVYWARRARAIR